MKFVFTIFIAFATFGCSSTKNFSVLETNDGSFAYNLSGKNSDVTLVLESGLGDDMTSWKSTSVLLDKHAQVFTYNRAGFSNSKSSNKERTGSTIVNELRTTLKTLGLPPPYVLVGHSLGGSYMELYARKYPNEVAGLVLIDPNSSRYPAACQERKLGHCEPPSDVPWYASIFYPAALKGEVLGFKSTHSQINAIDSFPDIPLVVLSSTNKQSLTEKQLKRRELNIQMHRELSQLSTKSKFISCDSCSHYVHHDNPELLVKSVVWVLDSLEVD